MEAPYDRLLEVKELSTAFRQGARETLAVDRISFAIKKGETVALVGESGSGKSVTALSVLKLLPYPAAHHPTGSIRFKNQELLDLPEAEIRRVRGDDITIIFQEPMTSLNPLHTIERQIGEILELHRGLTGLAARARPLPAGLRCRTAGGGRRGAAFHRAFGFRHGNLLSSSLTSDEQNAVQSATAPRRRRKPA